MKTQPAPFSPTMVCVIEDNDAVRDLICRALQGAGFATVSAGNGNAGVHEAMRCDPAVVVTDLLMAGCDGVQTILALKSKTPDVRILAISGGGERGGCAMFSISPNAPAPMTGWRNRSASANLSPRSRHSPSRPSFR